MFDLCFGFDFFISYAHSDGLTYARKLAEELEAHGFTCFLDTSDYALGDDWRSAGRLAMRRTSRLLLVGSPAATESDPVLAELRAFRALDRRVLPIDFEGSLLELEQGHPISEHVHRDHLCVSENGARLERGPSRAAVERIRGSFDLTRSNQKRQRVLLATVVLLALLTLASALGGLGAWRQTVFARERLSEAHLRTASVFLFDDEPGPAAHFLLQAQAATAAGNPSSLEARDLLSAWSLEMGRPLLDEGNPRAWTFSSDGSEVLVVTDRGATRWRAKDGARLGCVPLPGLERLPETPVGDSTREDNSMGSGTLVTPLGKDEHIRLVAYHRESGRMALGVERRESVRWENGPRTELRARSVGFELRLWKPATSSFDAEAIPLEVRDNGFSSTMTPIPVLHLQFAPSGERLYLLRGEQVWDSGRREWIERGWLEVWDFDSGLQSTPLDPTDVLPTALAIDPEGGRMALAFSRSSSPLRSFVVLVDPESGQQGESWELRSAAAAMSFGQDREVLRAFTGDGEERWDLGRNRPLRMVATPDNGVVWPEIFFGPILMNRVAFSPDGSRVLVLQGESRLPGQWGTLALHAAPSLVPVLAATDQDEVLIAGPKGRRTLAIDVARATARVLAGPDDPGAHVGGGVVRLEPLDGIRELRLESAGISDDGSRWYVVGSDASRRIDRSRPVWIEVHATASGERIARCEVPGRVRVSLHPRERSLVAAGAFGEFASLTGETWLAHWDFDSDTWTEVAKGEREPTAVGYGPEGDVFVTASDPVGTTNSTLHVWDARTREALGSLDLGYTARGVSFDPTGERVVLWGNAAWWSGRTGRSDTVHIVKVDGAETVGGRIQVREGCSVRAVAFDPDGRWIQVAGSRAGTGPKELGRGQTMLYSARTGYPAGGPVEVAGRPTACAFSADGKRAFVTVLDGERLLSTGGHRIEAWTLPAPLEDSGERLELLVPAWTGTILEGSREIRPINTLRRLQLLREAYDEPLSCEELWQLYDPAGVERCPEEPPIDSPPQEVETA